MYGIKIIKHHLIIYLIYKNFQLHSTGNHEQRQKPSWQIPHPSLLLAAIFQFQFNKIQFLQNAFIQK